MNIYTRALARCYFGQIKSFTMPDLGEKIKEATIKKWHVKVGDKVEEFDPVADVSTDKMFTQIPSSYTGKIHKIFHKEEDQCQVGEQFLEIEVESDGIVSIAKTNIKQETTQQTTSHQSVAQSITIESTGSLAIPKIRKLAKERGIDLSTIKGSGLNGRILVQDLQQTSTTQTQTQIKALTTTNVLTQESVIKMSDFQKGMQKTMTEANTIPHLYLQEEIDLSELAILREAMKKDKSITFMSLFIKAFSLALLKYPIVNSTYDISKPFQYVQHGSHNISLAMDSPRGLVVPHIKNVQNLSISEIHDELQRLRKLGESGQLGPKELFGGTVCISNIGTVGGTYTGPLILAPQVCIVGVGRMLTVPKYDAKNNVVPRKIINVSFGCDHRVLDGATVARFSNSWRSYLENPTSMLMNLK